jgi:hypothetical protein
MKFVHLDRFGSYFRQKQEYFFGNLMVPEFTCGKLILPTHFQYVGFCQWITGKKRQTYASMRGNIMG